MSPPAAPGRRVRRELARRRLAASGVAVVPPRERGGATAAEAVEVVERVVGDHLALQAQDLPGALWAVGARTALTQEQVLSAWQARVVTRTWPMRGTLHLLASRDLVWTGELLASRSLPANRARCSQLGLDDDDLARARRVVVGALEGRGTEGLTRTVLHGLLGDAGVDPAGQRGVMVLARLCLEGLLCQGMPQGSEPTFVLLELWVPDPWRPGREEAMASLADRYVRSHGPVTERDLAGWTGQTLTFTREAVALAGDRLTHETHAGTSYVVHTAAPLPAPAGVLLLPGFDEYLLGYKDRSVPLTAREEALVVPGGNGVFLPTVVVDGLVVGTWGRRLTPSRVVVTVDTWGPPSGTTTAASTARRVERAARDYGRFLGREVELRWAPTRVEPATEGDR